MVDTFHVVRRPLVTEKASALKAESNKVTFEVHPDATKVDVRLAVQKQFNVTVTSVATLNFRGKNKRVGQTAGRKSGWKKAIVTLKEGDEIDTLGQGQAEEG